MKSRVTSKFQTTVPKAIRDHLGLEMQDILEWKLENGKVTIYSVKQNFLKHQNSIQVGPGDIDRDIQNAWNKRLEKYR